MTNTITEPAKLPTCPEWCTSRGHDFELGAGDEPLHHGPRFGDHLVPTMFYGRLRASLDDCAADDLTPAGLRQLATDALAAAEWLEAHR